MNIDWGFTLAVVVVGLVVVFAVLLLLVLLCTLMGRAFQSADKNKKAKKDGEVTQSAKSAKPATPVKEQAAVAVAPVVESGIGDDVVAAISAALACMMGGESKFAVKSIKRARGARPVWNSAGISENTRPF